MTRVLCAPHNRRGPSVPRLTRAQLLAWLRERAAEPPTTTPLDAPLLYARRIEWREECLARFADIASGAPIGWEHDDASWNDVRTHRRAALPPGALLALLTDLDRRLTAAIAALPEGAIESNPMLRAWIVWCALDGRDAPAVKLP